jgi:hypothetical protein
MIFAPPFTTFNGVIQGGFPCLQRELDEWAQRGKVTLIEPALPARTDYEVWVDEAMRPHYGPIKEVWEFLNAFCDNCIKEGTKALRNGDFEKADHYAGLALCANDRRVESLAIRYIVRGYQGKGTSLKVIKRLVAEGRTEEFEGLVKEYGGTI